MKQVDKMTSIEIEHSCHLIEQAVKDAIERGVDPNYINWLVSEASGKDNE